MCVQHGHILKARVMARLHSVIVPLVVAATVLLTSRHHASITGAQVSQAGDDWTKAEDVTLGNGGTYWQRLLADSIGVLHLVWLETGQFGAEQVSRFGGIGYSQQRDGQWSEPVDVKWESERPIVGMTAAIDDRDEIHAFWVTEFGCLMHSHSSAERASEVHAWSDGRCIVPCDTCVDSRIDSGFDVTTDSLWVVNPQPRRLSLLTSTDHGESWTEVDGPTFPSLVDAERWVDTSLAIDRDGDVHLTWSERGKDDAMKGVLYAYLSRAGGVWREPYIFDDHPNGEPRIVAGDRNDLYVMWNGSAADVQAGRVGRYFSTSLDGGDTWSAPVSVLDRAGLCGAPAMVTDSSGTLHAAMCDGGLYYRSSDDSGWTSTVDLDPGNERNIPALAVTNGNTLHVSWESGGVVRYASRVVSAPVMVAPTAVRSNPTPLSSAMTTEHPVGRAVEPPLRTASPPLEFDRNTIDGKVGVGPGSLPVIVAAAAVVAVLLVVLGGYRANRH